jgi:hypothetical protein
MDTNRLKVTYANKDDIQSMLKLNYKIYPKEWHVSPDFVQSIMNQNNKVYRILHSDQEVKGIYSLFPIPKDIYHSVLNGQIDEKELEKHIIDYDKPKEVYLYLISIIVDIFDSNRKDFAKRIIKDLPLQLNKIEEMGIKIMEIGAIAISDEGEKILPKIGFTHHQEYVTFNDQRYPIFRGTKSDILKAVK